MAKERLEKEAENWLRKYLLCCNCEKKCNCIDSNSYCEEQVLKSYIAGAEPREKRIADLESQIEKMKCCINDLVHLGEFNEHTDEEYFNYQVHEALKNAEQFIKESK